MGESLLEARANTSPKSDKLSEIALKIKITVSQFPALSISFSHILQKIFLS